MFVNEQSENIAGFQAHSVCDHCKYVGCQIRFIDKSISLGTIVFDYYYSLVTTWDE